MNASWVRRSLDEMPITWLLVFRWLYIISAVVNFTLVPIDAIRMTSGDASIGTVAGDLLTGISYLLIAAIINGEIRDQEHKRDGS